MFFGKIIAGLLGGIIGGMGMGGGTLTIPILTLFLHFEQISAQAINLIAFLPMSVIAIVIHTKNKLVEYKQTWLLAAIGSLFSVGAAILANRISSSTLKKLFALFLIGLGIWQIVEMKKQNKKNKQNENNKENKENKNKKDKTKSKAE